MPDTVSSAVAYDRRPEQVQTADPGAETQSGTHSGPPRQQPLFAQKVIPFESLVTTRRQYGRRREAPRVETETPRPRTRASQTSFELRAPAIHAPATAAPSAGEAPVASPGIRARAAAVDLVFCVIGIGVFAVTFQLFGGAFSFGNPARMWWGATGGLLVLSYHLFFAMTGHNTAGMRCYGLTLVTFDGGEPDARLRVVRLFWTLLFAAAFGFGLLWAWLDDERLGCQDQITKSYPAPRESSGTLRRR
ncbi:MAG TPA: RDD family protein [Bryobacteraceae bacterium]|nr:RDD family protein [Bryobacteraceae bacterium]